MSAAAASRRRRIAPAGRAATAGFARKLLRMRRLRESMLGGQFFSDPAWDILLDLYVRTSSGGTVSASGLGLSSMVPSTTALRWISAMVDAGLLVRDPDPNDGRRALIGFGPGAEESLEILLTRAMAELGAGTMGKG
ncbi:MAG: MarR family transcriptional regulator [Alphaproteobacteria bacterium]|nr:MarR family transcriptional regulator [Alphaproteobacteria bacterium]